MSEPGPLSRRVGLLIPLLLCAAALFPRLVALNWGLPYVEHSDEPAVLEVAVKMAQRPNFNPGIFLYPSLHYYMLMAVIWLHGLWGIGQGLYVSLADLPTKNYLFTTAPELLVWTRGLTAILGAATIPAIYALGRRMFDRRVALLAALTLAWSSYHVEHSHFVTTDVPTGLWVTFTLLGAWMITRDGAWHGYLLGGIATGLAAGTKYNAGPVGMALATATLIVLLDARHAGRFTPGLARRQIGRLVAAGILAVLVFLATTPFAVLDWEAFRRSMQISTTHYASGSHGNFTGRWRLDGYLQFLWTEGLLWAGSLIALAGLPLVARRSPRELALLLTAVFVCWGLLLTQAVNFHRNLLPVIPLLFLLAAAGAVALADGIGRLSSRGVGVEGPQIIDIRPDGPPSTVDLRRAQVARQGSGAALALLAGALIIPQALDTTWLLRYWSRPHTLVAAAELLRTQPRGMLAALEANPVQWAGDPAAEPVYWLARHDPDWYRARGYRFLLLNSERYGPGAREAYEALLAGGTVILALPERDHGLQPGPGGALLDLGEHVETIPFVRRSARFGDAAELLGYELRPGELRSRITPLEGADQRELGPGQPIQINLYWRSLSRMPIDYTLFLHLYDDAGERVAQRDLPLRYGDYMTSNWQPGELVIDRADMPLPALPPGEYSLRLGLYDAATGVQLPLEGGTTAYTLTTISIR